VIKFALIVFLLTLTPAFGQPGVFNIRVGHISHSTVQLVWDTTSIPNHMRVRYGLTTAYEAGPGGGIQGSSNNYFTAVGLTSNISGLAPSTTYHFCPQVSSDRGTTWSECVNFTAATTERPSVHPEYPEPPPTFDSSYPDVTGYTIRSVASNCSDLQAHMAAAAAAQVTAGSIIEIPAGTVCKGSYTLPSGRDVKRFPAGAVRTSTATITLPGHGFTDGQQVKLAGFLPGTAGPDVFRQYRGIKHGDSYFIKRINADAFQLSDSRGGPPLEFTTSAFTADAAANTFTVPSANARLMEGVAIQVKSSETLPEGLRADTTYYVKNPSAARTFQLAASPGGAAIDITSSGTGTHWFADQGGGGSILAWPPSENWIIVRTAVRDEQFVPEGVRVTPEWKSRMATIKSPARWDRSGLGITLTHEHLVHHWRFVGIEFTHDDLASAEIQTTIDPHGHYGFLWFWRDAGNIILDRCYIHGLGYPNRIYRAIVGYDGENMAIINSYWEKLDWWRPYRDGVKPTMTNSSTLTISRGTYFTGPAQRTLSDPVSVVITGETGTGAGRVYFDLSGTLQVLLPEGTTATCSGYSPCVVRTAASPEFPRNNDPDPRMAAAPIASITLANGALTAVTSAQEPSTGVNEGAASFIAGTGPGPFLIENNHISGTGLPIHFDDMGNGHYAPGRGYIIRRNHFTAPLSQIAGSQWSDGKRYGHRHLFEMKNGTHILIEGNIFENSFAENTPLAVPLAIMATDRGQVTDVTIQNNLFQSSAGGIGIKGPIDVGTPGKTLQRVHIFNNLFYRLNGFEYVVKPSEGSLGVQISLGYAMEDIRIENNTVYDSRGTAPYFLIHGQDPMEGMSITNNVIWANGHLTSSDNYGHNNYPTCPQVGKSALDCAFRSGVGRPEYDFVGNTIIAGWADAQGTKPQDPNWIRSFLGGLDARIYSIAEAVENLGWLFDEKDLQMRFRSIRKPSPSRRATDNRATGADPELLTRALGRIQAGNVLDVRTSSAAVSFVAHAKGSRCYVLYGTGDDVTLYSRTEADRSDSLERRIELKDLSPGFRHDYVVMCEGAQEHPRGTFDTRTE
jgi:hypothetical protein